MPSPRAASFSHAPDLDYGCLADIDAALAAKAWLTPLPKQLAARYAGAQRAALRPHNRRVLFFVAFMFDLFHFSMFKSAPEIVPLSAWLRLGVMTPAAGLFLVLDSQNRLGRFYSPCLVFITVLPTLIAAILVLNTSPDNHTCMPDLYAIPLLLLATGLVARLTPLEVFCIAGLSVAAFCFAVSAAAFVPATSLTSLLLSDTAVGLGAVMFNLQLEARDRRVFLLRGADAIIRTALTLRNQGLLAQAQTDGLTGVANRRCFDETFATTGRDACATSGRLGLIIIDIDHFKKFNDRYGHQGGDDCLRLVATRASQDVRQGDLFARYGGEEFAVILPGAPLADAVAVAERIRTGILTLNLPHQGAGEGKTLTVSLGVAVIAPTAADDPRRLIELADSNLYAAKRGGRNQVSASLEFCA
jgi:diguanylate cyclase (GGDEF)-like protein